MSPKIPPMSGAHLLTVVMPVYNERSTLRAAVERLLKTDLPLPIELVVVDDGSTDDSLAAIADIADGDRVRLVRHQRNAGKGAAVRTGIAVARGDLLTILDADLEYDPGDYKRLVEPILTGEARVTYGTRGFGAHTAFSFWYVVGNRFINLWASLLFNTWLSDLATCLKVAPTELWRRLELRTRGFDIDAEATARFLGLGERIFEVPISYRARPREEGKKVHWSDGLRHMWALARIRFTGR